MDDSCHESRECVYQKTHYFVPLSYPLLIFSNNLAIIWYGEDIQIYLYYNQLYCKFLVSNCIEGYAINIYSLENEKVNIGDTNNRKNRFVILQRNGFFSTM